MLTILFVEDDSAVCEVVMQMLYQRGFAILTAGDAYDAIRILSERHVDVLFTDIIMPDMGEAAAGVPARTGTASL